MNTKRSDIPLDWKIGLDNNVNKLIDAAENIMEIISTLPKPGKVFKTKTNGIKILVERISDEEVEEFERKAVKDVNG